LVQQPFVLTPCVDFDTGGLKPAGVDSRVPVRRDDIDAVASKRERRGLARAGEPDDEDAAWKLQRRKNVKSR
jgi:hypothetical protein